MGSIFSTREQMDRTPNTSCSTFLPDSISSTSLSFENDDSSPTSDDADAAKKLELMKEVVSNQTVKAAAVCGAVVLGSGGCTAGVMAGGAFGAVVGVVPALFTFCTSIPICA